MSATTAAGASGGDSGNRHNILITGTPRSGTTLTCHLLNKVPNTLALHEPMRPKRLAGMATAAERVAAVAAFCAEQRRMALEEGRAVSKNEDGQVPDNPVGGKRTDAGLRTSKVSRGYVAVTKPLSPDFALAIKHNSGFAALLEELTPHFPVFAVIRNPLATIGSWSSVTFNVQDGHSGVGENLNDDLRRMLAAIADPLDRQVALLDWFHRRFLALLPPDRIIRYEAMIRTGGRALAVVRPAAAELDEPLVERDLTQYYDRDHLLRIGERLLAADGAFWTTYDRGDVERLLTGLARTPAEDAR